MSEELFDYVVIGHVARETNNTVTPPQTYNGGAAYYSAVAASLFAGNVGIVSRVGADFPIDALQNKNIDTQGIIKATGNTAAFTVGFAGKGLTQRTFSANLGVGADVCYQDIPDEYLHTKHIHIATAPPKQQQGWIEYVSRTSSATISIDTMKQFIVDDRETVLHNASLADIIFLNEEEQEAIASTFPNKTCIVKKGPNGAVYMQGETSYHAPTHEVRAYDPAGAGDVFGAVFSVLEKEKGYQRAMQVAVKVATDSIQKCGVDFLLDNTYPL